MNEKDKSVLGVGAIIAIIVLIGSAVLEGEEPEEGSEGRFNVIVMDGEIEAASENDHCNEDESKDFEYTIDQETIKELEGRYIISVEAILTWDDDRPSLTSGDNNDEFSLEISGNDTTESSSSTSGEIREKIDIQPKPKSNPSYAGESIEKVEKELGKDYGMGLYKVTVKCVSAGNRDPTPFGQDNGNDFELKIVVKYYALKVSLADTCGK